MDSTNKRWQENIAEAMNEAEKNQTTQRHTTIMLPNWIAYAVCILFGFLLAKTLVTGVQTPHKNLDRDYQTGSSVALLMVAEDVEHYKANYGKLPDELPSPIAAVIDVSYEKVSQDHFRLTMPHGESTITFDAKDDKIYMD